jgi:hypothetical protein
MIQVVGPQRRVYIKFVNNERMLAVLQTLQGQMEYHHENGVITSASGNSGYGGTARTDSETPVGGTGQNHNRSIIKIW